MTDPAGAPLSGVQVILSAEPGAHPIATLTTSPDGHYSFKGLAIGQYRVEAELPGYRRAVSDHVGLNSREAVVEDLRLVPVATMSLPAQAGASSPRVGGDTDATMTGYYEGTEFKAAELSGSIDAGGYSSAGQAEINRSLFDGAARLKEAPGGAPTGKAPPSDRRLVEIETRLKESVQSAPRSFEANTNLGEFYIHTGRLANAIPYLKAAYRLDPSRYANGYDLALAYLETRDYAAAREQVHAMLASAAADRRRDAALHRTVQRAAELHNLLGEIEERSGNFVEAVNEYERAARLEPTEKNIFDWGLELLAHQTLEAALEVLRSGVARYPGSSQLLVGYGIALYSRGRYDEAVEALVRASDVNPADPRPYSFLAQVSSISPKQAGAVTDHLRRFAELQPGNAQAVYSYARALWKARQEQEDDRAAVEPEVEKLLNKAAALDPQFAEPHLDLGALYAGRKQYPAAIREYAQAIKLKPGLADAHYRLGQAYARTGELARAQQEFRVYERLHKQQLADRERQREAIRQFVFRLQNASK